MQFLELSNSQTESGRWVSRAGEGDGVLVWEDGTILEMDGGILHNSVNVLSTLELYT